MRLNSKGPRRVLVTECPKCKRTAGSIQLKKFHRSNHIYTYAYFVHYLGAARNNKRLVRWCYLGKPERFVA